MKTLLLIGHGYLGAAAAARFRGAGWQVGAAALHPQQGVIPCDVADPAAVAALAAAVPTPDLVIHCAASGRAGPDAYRRVFVQGCRNLVRSFPAARLIQISSSSVYAQTDGSTVTEESPALPLRETGKLLLQAERVTLRHGGAVCRLAGIYGPGRSVIQRDFLNGAARLEDDGRRFLNQIHRDDAVSALLHLAANPQLLAGEIYNVCDSHPLSQLECYQSLSSRFGLPLPRDENRKRGWSHKKVSNAKLRATGWEPRFPCFLDAAPLIAPSLMQKPPGTDASA